jgi:ketosteroid isomerase-like protein
VPRATPGSGYKIIPATTAPTVTPGQILLLDLEGKFAAATAEGGGKAFAQWFAEDAVTLSDGKPAVFGRGAIARDATWSPKEYTLTWTAQGAQMGPSNDMGFTWGHYEGKSTGVDGKPVVSTGRYITIWKKQSNGEWKVAMDASANEPPANDCCAVKHP